MENNLVLLFFLFFFLLFFRTTFQLNEKQSASDRLSSRAEWAALIQLRASLGLRTKDWPIKSDPCLGWIGVLCRDGSVIGINVSGFKRTRIGNKNPNFSVGSLANFPKLVSFNASRFVLPGSIPNWLGIQVHSLRVLDLRFCEISGAIPSSIGNLTNLGELYLSDNNLTGGIPDNLGLLSRISVLDLSRNSLTGLIPFSLGFLSKLSLLDISSNTLSGVIPEDFGNLLNLKSLNLSNNGLSSSIPTRFGNLSSLVVLDLSFNSLSGSVPSEFGSLRNLQRMVICNNNFTGDLPDALWSLPNLRFLDVSSNNFMGFLPNVSLHTNTTIAVFNLSHNMFYGVLPSVLKRVHSVDLSFNYFQGKIPDYARNVASLDRNCFRSWSSQRNVKECAGFYYRKGMSFDNFGLPNGTNHLPSSDHKSNRRVVIFAAVMATVGFVLLFVILVVILIICSRKARKTAEIGSGLRLKTDAGAPGASLKLFGEAFGYEKILAATGDFNDGNLVKNGHSGDVFKGVFEDGIHIIVKRFYVHSKKNGCKVELDFFSKVSHPRLVPLIGHCLEKEKEHFLIYKYMPKRDLSSSLYRKTSSDDDSLKSLDWITRLKIAIGVAEGLSYLHHECTPPFVHRDVQASSILLDDKYEVRLGSLTEVCIQENHSHSNKITRLLRLPQISEEVASGVATATCMYDVYCFGKVLLELVTGKIGISASSDSTSKELLEGLLPFIYDKELVKIIIDPSLIVDEDLLDEVWAMAVVAKSCLNPKPSRRPLMRFVLKALENPLKVVREEISSSAKLGTSSSSSWNGSWRHSLAAGCGGSGKGELRVGGGGEEGCLSTRRYYSKDVFPEPMGVEDEEKWND